MVVVARDLLAPVVVVERVAERAAEAVAARLGDHVHHPAAEAAVLGRDAVGCDHCLLHRIFDVEVVGLAAEVLVHVDAVDEVQRLERHRAGDRVAAVRPRRVHGRRFQNHGVDIARRRQRRHQLLLEVGGHFRRVRHEFAGARPHVDGLAQRCRAEGRIERERLTERHSRRFLLPLESAELEVDAVRARRDARDDVIAVLGGHHGERALQVGTSDRHRDAGQREALAIDNPSRDRARRRLRRQCCRQQQDERPSTYRFAPPHDMSPLNRIVE